MKHINAIAVASAMYAALKVEAFSLNKRAIECDDILPQMNADLATATSFCQVYLQTIPRTVTETSTTTRLTRTSTTTEYATDTSIITPATRETTRSTTTTTSTTVTPATLTVTAQATSTAYVAPDGTTIALLKRNPDPSPVELAQRAMATPVYLQGLSKADIVTACECLNIPTSTYTRSTTAIATGTTTKSLQRTIKETTTLPTETTTTTTTSTRDITIFAAAPRETETAVSIEQIRGCPPATTSDYLCPAQTGADDGTNDGQLSCTVLAQDGFAGYCLYWDDDGSAAFSTLSRGDGSGDPDNDIFRDAVYGDAPTDDCPSWSDFTCTAGGPGRRSILEKLADEHIREKRGFVPHKISLAEHLSMGRKKMPKGLRRGGKYRKTMDMRKLRKLVGSS